MGAVSIKLGKTSVITAEATMLRNGVKIAFQMGYYKLYVEGDS